MFEGSTIDIQAQGVIAALLLGLCLPATAGASQVCVDPRGAGFTQLTRDTTDLLGSLTDVVCAGWQHGMPRMKILALGPEALPLLAEMLQDDEYRHCWSNVSVAIGAFGDTSYFDTLRAFVWDRFRGPVGMVEFMAIFSAQVNIAYLAKGSDRAVTYMLETSEAGAWLEIPWWEKKYPRAWTKEQMARATNSALCVIDDDRVGKWLDRATWADSMEATSCRRVHREVREMGLRQWFEREERESVYNR